MAKVKLSNKEIRRTSLILGKEIEAKKATIENTKNQEFSPKERKAEVLEMQKNDVHFLETIKEKFDIETFGKNG